MINGINLTERLAVGDTAEVFRATDGRYEYAVKVLHAHLANDPIVRSRFQREAETLAGISHPNVVRVHGTTEHDGRPGLVMELLTGGSIRGKRMAVQRAADLLRDLCDALAHLHAKGIVHRDIRPSHILFSAEGSPKLTDFGMASIRDLSGLTRSTVFASNLSYVDPYTWGRSRPQPTHDLYSLGAVFYELLSGSPPPSALFGNGSEASRAREMSAFREKSGHVVTDVICGMLDRPGRRPRSAREVIDWIDAGRVSGLRDIAECIHCGAAMPREAAICLECGKVPLDIVEDPYGCFLLLRKISEEREVLSPFLRKLQILSAVPIEQPRLLIGNTRLYSRSERRSGFRLPARIADSIAAESVDALIAALVGDSGRKIRIEARPITRSSYRRSGPLIRLRYGRIVAPAAAAALRSLVARRDAQTQQEEPSADLRREIANAIGIAVRRVSENGGAIEPTDVEALGQALYRAADRLDQTEGYLQSVNLQEAYAALERGRLQNDKRDSAARQVDDAQAIFRQYADSERSAAMQRQTIVDACRILERLSGTDLLLALEQVSELLDAGSSAKTHGPADTSDR